MHTSMTDERRKKLWYMNTMACYEAVRKDKIIQFAETWLKL